MGIDKDIHQTGFKNGYNKAMVNILFTNNWLLEQIKGFVKKEDITPQQYNILRILRSSEAPLSTLQIRERMLDKMSDTSRIVDRLIAKNLVKKETSARDKRLVDISITESGNDLLNKLDTQEDDLDKMLKNISEEEAETISMLLDKLRNQH